ncbi:MAG: Ig-like domain-containing protein, partial [Gemmatimonadetes bacterium]|nr:Ig-like domain-containing protein [Gemmatimonadota bacterium]
MSSRALPLLLVLAGVLIVAVSCNSATDSAVGVPASLQIVAGDGQTGIAGEQLPYPLIARVIDSRNRPVKGQIVNFRVVAGGGSVFAGAGLTNDTGVVQERWTLGPTAGDSQRVEARAVDPSTGTPLVFGVFKAVGRAGPAATMTIAGGDEQNGHPGTLLPESLSVVVRDKHDNPVPADTVRWTTAAGSGSIGPPVSLTNESGVAKAGWTLPMTTDSAYHASATRTGLPMVTFRALTGVAGITLLKTAGDSQTAIAGTAVSESLEVTARWENGNPVVGGTVEWSASLGGGAVTPATTVTNQAGKSRARWMLGSTSSQRTLASLRVGGVVAATAEFVATAVQGPPPGSSLTLTIASPANLSVARPDLRVAASCTNSSSDCVVRVILYQPGYASAFLLAVAPGSLDQTVSLASYDGQLLQLLVCAEDESGLVWPYCASRKVYVESSTRLVEVDSTRGGEIIDADGERLLFRRDTTPEFPEGFCSLRICQAVVPAELTVRERLSGQETLVTAQPVNAAKLTAAGVVFWLDVAQLSHWHEWRNGVNTDMGFIGGPIVNGDFAVWNTSGSVPDGTSQLILRDLVGQTNTTVAHYGYGSALTSTGDLWYSAIRREDGTDLRTYQLFKYSGGTRTQLTSNTLRNHSLAMTDGTNVVYLRETGGLTGPVTESALILLEPAGETIVYE